MTAHAHAILPPRMARHWRGLLLGSLFALFLLVVLIWSARQSAESKALLRMEPGERSALYTQTLQSAQSVCAEADLDPALAPRCRSATEFLLAFPECDDACRALAEAHRRRPKR